MNEQQAWFQGWPVVEKIGGPGSGWFAPPRGTHVSAVTAKTAAQMRAELKRDFKRKTARVKQLQGQGGEIMGELSDLVKKRTGVVNKRVIAQNERRYEDVKRLDTELRQIDKEMAPKSAKLRKINGEAWNVRKSIREGAREKLKVANPAEFKTNMGKLRSGKTELQEGSDAFASMMGRGTLDGKTVTMGTAGGDRGHYKNDGVYLPPINRISKVAVHELGHWLEDKDPKAHSRAMDFFYSRTKGERTVRLSKVTGDPHYRSDEVCKPDKFMDPYAGKVYTGPYSEIISMGVEHFYSEPVKFATEDPGYFDFIYNLMRGE